MRYEVEEKKARDAEDVNICTPMRRRVLPLELSLATVRCFNANQLPPEICNVSRRVQDVEG